MGYFRSVSTDFWTDSKVGDDFSPEDKYFYLYLLTNPHTTLSGCYELSLRQASTETGYTTETVKVLLDRLATVHGVIMYSPVTKEVLVKNWSKYNWPNSEKVMISIVKYTESDVKNDEFRDYIRALVSERKERTKEKNKIKDKDKDKDKDKSDSDSDQWESNRYEYPIDTVSEKPKKKKEKHQYGANRNVLLTDEELEKLKERFQDYEKKIDDLSYYMASKKTSYASHYMTILNWARKDEQKDAPKKASNDWLSSYGREDGGDS